MIRNQPYQPMPRHASRYLDSQQPKQPWPYRACAWLGRQRHSESLLRRKVAIALVIAVALPLILIEQIVLWQRGLTARRADEIVNRIGQFAVLFFAAYFAWAVVVAICSGAFERAVR